MTEPTIENVAAIHRAWCCGRKLTTTFGDAGLEIKTVTVVLWIVALAAVVVWARGVWRRDGRTAQRIAWLGGWQTGGPLLGGAGVAYLAMNFWVAVYAYPPATLAVYAPGWAEMSMVLWAGLLAGSLAAIARASLRGRMGDGAPASEA